VAAARWLGTAETAAAGFAPTQSWGPSPVAPRTTSNWREASYLDEVADMLAIPKDELATARQVLSALRDPLGRTVLEQLSRRAQDPVGLIEKSGRDYDAIRYQIRKLIAAGAVSKLEHSYYLANPDASHAVRNYVDVLLTLSSYTKSRSKYHVH
jgi:hypothetical protein